MSESDTITVTNQTVDIGTAEGEEDGSESGSGGSDEGTESGSDEGGGGGDEGGGAE